MSYIRKILTFASIGIAVLSFASRASAQVDYKIVAGFDGSVPAATSPTAGVIKGSDGAFYGTTQNGNFCGAVYKVTLDGTRDVMHVFKGRTVTPADGCQPTGELVEVGGFLYGTTMSGGENADDVLTGGTGTIFRILPTFHDGDPVGYEVLYHFRGRNASNVYPDGVSPMGGLTLDRDGNVLYGLTGGGGAGFSATDVCNQSSSGTFFRFNPPGTLEVLHSFVPAEACNPRKLNVLMSNGNFVGVANAASQLGNPPQGFGGTVFEITTDGSIVRLFRFPSGASAGSSPYGAGPGSAPVEDRLGNLYGTALNGGPSTDGTAAGTVYKLSPAGSTWNPELLHAFTGPDGAFPVAGLTWGSDEFLYGVTSGGGAFTNGTVFRITPAGALSDPPLHTFECGNPPDCSIFDPDDGFGPEGRLVEASPGFFIGTTRGGNGPTVGGSVFSIALAAATTTTTTLAASSDVTVFGQSVTLMASVSASSGNPSGTVEFFDGGSSIGTASLSAGTAAFMTADLSVGAHSIAATYHGDGTFLQSTSSLVSVTVNRAATTTTLSSSPNPSHPKEQVTITARVDAVSPGAGVPSGQVDFFDGKNGRKKLATVRLVDGAATFDLVLSGMGAHDLKAAYTGDGNFAGSASVTLIQVVQK